MFRTNMCFKLNTRIQLIRLDMNLTLNTANTKLYYTNVLHVTISDKTRKYTTREYTIMISGLQRTIQKLPTSISLSWINIGNLNIFQ